MARVSIKAGNALDPSLGLFPITVIGVIEAGHWVSRQLIQRLPLPACRRRRRRGPDRLHRLLGDLALRLTGARYPPGLPWVAPTVTLRKHQVAVQGY